MGLRALLRNLTKLVLMGFGGLIGAVVVVWARANDDWATIRLPAVMAPGSSVDVEYEAKIWAIVAIAFSAGVLGCIWIALAVWIRAVRRERRLALALERLESQLGEKRGLTPKEAGATRSRPLLPPAPPGVKDFDEFDELTPEGLDGRVLSDIVNLPEGYDEGEELADDDGGDEEPSPGGARATGGDRG